MAALVADQILSEILNLGHGQGVMGAVGFADWIRVDVSLGGGKVYALQMRLRAVAEWLGRVKRSVRSQCPGSSDGRENWRQNEKTACRGDSKSERRE